MKKIWHKCFHVPKDGYVSEVILMNRITSTICFILVCLGVMGFSAYAFFSSDISSSPNKVVAASYDVAVEIFAEGSNVALSRSEGGVFSGELVNTTYTIKLTKRGQGSTGYCHIVIADQEYGTQQIGMDVRHPEGGTDTITFTVVVQGNANITITPCWGTSSYYSMMLSDNAKDESYIVDGDVITVVGENKAEDPAETTPPATETTQPTIVPTEPTTRPDEPTTKPTQQATVPNKPSTEPTEPETEPTEPETEPTEPETEPTEPETEPTEPETEPTEPETEPTEPETEPTEPETEPTEPETEPTEPETEPTEPETESTEPGDAP